MNNKIKFGSNIGKLGDDGVTPFIVAKREIPVAIYDVFLQGEISESEDFLEATLVLSQAQENDMVNIHLNSHGGSLHAVDSLIHSMMKTEAHVHVIATGQVASAATFVLMSGDSFEISQNCSLMCHNASYGTMGKASDIKAHVEHSDALIHRVLDTYYTHFFTEQEMLELYAGKEFYMFAEEFADRFSRRVEALQSENEGEPEDFNDTLIEEQDLVGVYDPALGYVKESVGAAPVVRKPRKKMAATE